MENNKVGKEILNKEFLSLQDIDKNYLNRVEELKERLTSLYKESSEVRMQAEAEGELFDPKQNQELIDKSMKALADLELLFRKWENKRDDIPTEQQPPSLVAYFFSPEESLNFIKEDSERTIYLYGYMMEHMTEEEKLKEDVQSNREKLHKVIEINYKELEKKRFDDTELLKATKNLESLLDDPALDKMSAAEIRFTDEVLKNNLLRRYVHDLNHLEQTSPELYKDALAFIDECINKKNEYLEPKQINRVTTKYPKDWITSVDKVSGLAFDGEGTLYRDRPIGIRISSQKSKKEILSYASLSLDDENVHIIGNAELDEYDREIHDAIATLCVEGKNEVITPQMIYKTMTGNKKARLTTKQYENISNSLKKLTRTRIRIKASKEECQAYERLEEFEYEGNVISANRIKAVFKDNEAVEAFKILDIPILYAYAEAKGQIGRIDIKLLDSPVNKSDETIKLQSYLCRRILAMKKNKGMKKTILYDTLYKQLSIESASKSSLRNKKMKIREAAKKILTYWIEEEFINGFFENSQKGKIVSITIQC